MKDKKLLLAAWSCNNKGYAGYYNWYLPLKKKFKNFVSFDPQQYLYKYGRDALNKKFLEVVEKEKPDYIFFWLIYDEFYIDTLIKIKEISPKTKMINFFGDDDVIFEEFSKYYSLFFDYGLVVQTDYVPRYKKENLMAFPSIGVDTSYFVPEKLKKRYDVTFVGMPKADRYEMVKYLRDQGVNVRVFGWGWEKYTDLKDIYGGALANEDFVKMINQSKINLSFAKNYVGKPHFVGRPLEILSCNAFVLSDYYKGYNEFFKEDKELVMYKDKKDMLEKIKYYLKNDKEREKVAKAGYERIVKNYTNDGVLERTFKKISADKKERKKGLPRVKGKIEYLSGKDMALKDLDLSKKLRGCDYVCFRKGNCRNVKHREIFQIYSLQKSKKKISCCDYYLYSPGVGDYLALYTAHAFRSIPKKDFMKLLNVNQLMVEKKYFVENVQEFRKLFFSGKTNLIQEENTAFINMSLVRIEEIKPVGYDKMDIAFNPLYENNLRLLRHQKKVWYLPYLYKLLLNSLMVDKFIYKQLFKKVQRKVL